MSRKRRFTLSLFACVAAGLFLGAATSFTYLGLPVRRDAPAKPRQSHHTVMSHSPMRPLAPVVASAGSGELRSPAAPMLSDEGKTQIAEAYYEAINTGDLATAYSLLSSSFHSYESFSQFQQAYSSTIRMTIKGLRAYDGQPAIGIALLDGERNGDGAIVNGYVGYLRFAYDFNQRRWLIDERKLTKVGSENIEPPSSVASAQSQSQSGYSDQGPASSNVSSGASAIDTPPPEAVATPECRSEAIKDISNSGTMITTDTGDSFDLTSSTTATTDWTINDPIQVCESPGAITLTKGDVTVSANRHE